MSLLGSISVIIVKNTWQAAIVLAAALLPITWLPPDPVGAAIIGLIGGLLRWSVAQNPLKKGLITVAAGMGVAIFGNGIQVPGIAEIASADSLWRVNTLVLAFLGVSVLGVFDDIWTRFSEIRIEKKAE